MLELCTWWNQARVVYFGVYHLKLMVVGEN